MELSIPHTKAREMADSQDKDKASSCAFSVTTTQMGNSCLTLCSWGLVTQCVIFSFSDTVKIIWGNVCCLFPFLSFHKLVTALATFSDPCDKVSDRHNLREKEIYLFVYIIFFFLIISWGSGHMTVRTWWPSNSSVLVFGDLLDLIFLKARIKSKDIVWAEVHLAKLKKANITKDWSGSPRTGQPSAVYAVDFKDFMNIDEDCGWSCSRGTSLPNHGGLDFLFWIFIPMNLQKTFIRGGEGSRQQYKWYNKVKSVNWHGRKMPW